MARPIKLAAVAVVLALALFAGAAEANKNKDKNNDGGSSQSVVTDSNGGYGGLIVLAVTAADVTSMRSKKGGTWSKTKTSVFGGISGGISVIYEFPTALFPGINNNNKKGRRMLAAPGFTQGSFGVGFIFTSMPIDEVMPTVAPTSLDLTPKQRFESMKSETNVKAMAKSCSTKGGNGDIKISGDLTSDPPNFLATFSGALGRDSESGSLNYAGFLPTKPNNIVLSPGGCNFGVSVRNSADVEICSAFYDGLATTNITFGSPLDTWKTIVGTGPLSTKYSCSFTAAPLENPCGCFTGNTAPCV